MKVNPANVDAMFNAGLCYAEQKNFEKTKELMNAILEINPEYPYAYYTLAMAYETEKDYAKAVENYEKFINLSTDEKLKSELKDRVNFLKSKI